jgi:hypothetical protein
MEKKKRIKIPQGIADDVMFEADNICCVCHKPGLEVQIHHIDENPSNNSPENLIVLCLEDHAKISAKKGMGKGMSPGVLKKRKAEWCESVRGRKEQSFGKSKINVQDVDAYLEALACHEIRKATFGIDRKDWHEVKRCLAQVYPYAESWLYGDAVRREVLDLLYSLACATRHEMPVDIANQISHMSASSLPMASLVAKAHRLPDDFQMDLFRSAITIGFALAHDGVKYLKDIKVTKAGLQLLHKVLRYSHLNSLEVLKKEALQNFEHFVEVAGHASNEKAIEWGNFERDDALALDGDPLPKLPRE